MAYSTGWMNSLDMYEAKGNAGLIAARCLVCTTVHEPKACLFSGKGWFGRNATN